MVMAMDQHVEQRIPFLGILKRPIGKAHQPSRDTSIYDETPGPLNPPRDSLKRPPNDFLVRAARSSGF